MLNSEYVHRTYTSIKGVQHPETEEEHLQEKHSAKNLLNSGKISLAFYRQEMY